MLSKSTNCLNILKINKQLLTRFNYNIFSFSTKEEKIKEEQKLNEIHNYVTKFNGQKFERFNDMLLVNNKLLGKPSINTDSYLVFKSNLGYSVIKVLLLQLVMVIPCLVFLYYSVKWTYREWQITQIAKMQTKKKYTNYAFYGYSSFVILSLGFLEMLRRNNLYKIWKYVKKIEISKDLKTLNITTFTNKTFTPILKDVYLYYNFSSPYISPRSLTKVEDTLVVGVKDKVLLVPLEKSTIQSKDLLSLCLRGYSMKFTKE